MITKYDFEQYQYTWIDQFLNSETRIDQGNPIQLIVISDRASSSSDRFVIQLNEPALQDSVSVFIPATLCPGQLYTAVIGQTQKGIYYSLWSENGKQVSIEKIGTGSELGIELLLDSIPSGSSAIKLVARSSCHQKVMNSSYTVTKEVLGELAVASSRSCMGNFVELTAFSDYPPDVYHWFEEVNSTDTLSTAAVFRTPNLTKPKTYYVSATNSAGCTTSRFPIRADIVLYDSAEITWEDGSTLAANYTHSNKWYFNGDLLEGEHNQTLTVDKTGTYTLVTDTLGCITKDSIEFLMTAAHVEKEMLISVFPNPVNDKLQIQILRGPFDTEIRNVVGEVVWSGRTDSGDIDISSLSAGVYFVTVYLEGGSKVVRFVKCE